MNEFRLESAFTKRKQKFPKSIWKHDIINERAYLSIYLYIYIYIYVCVCSSDSCFRWALPDHVS